MLVFGLSILGMPVWAQGPVYAPVDRIVAVVGQSVITQTRLEEEINVLRQQGETVPTDPDSLRALRRTILERMIDDELLVQAAEADTAIEVTEQELQASIEPALRQIRAGFASEMEYERNLRAAGFASADDYRRWMTEQKRRELLSEQYVQKLTQRGDITPLPPTEHELREYFEATRGQRPQRPPTVSFRQIVVRTLADSAELLRAYRFADSLATAIRNGADFGAVAREFSNDPGSAAQGGEMGWIRRGQGYVPEFERAAFALRPGVVSSPVQSAYGFHVMQVQRSQPAEVLLRHILIAPALTELNKAEARQKAQDIRSQLEQGASFDSLARIHHDPLEQRVIEDASTQDLPPQYATVLTSAQPGSFIGPIDLDPSGARPRYAIVALDGLRPGGEFTYADVRDVLRSSLAQQNGLDRLLRTLRGATYIDIRP